MTARVLFFSVLRDIAKAGEMEVEVDEDGVRMEEFLEMVMSRVPALRAWSGRVLIAVNCEYSGSDTRILPGDEVALMPPVQGG